MVISFRSERAYSQLNSEGYVATFRKNRRKRPNCETWCNRGRGQTKEFDVRISEIATVEPVTENLESLAQVSGFGDVESWQDEIVTLNESLPNSGWLYFVTKL